jgi:hypothetical protein
VFAPATPKNFQSIDATYLFIKKKRLPESVIFLSESNLLYSTADYKICVQVFVAHQNARHFRAR